MALVVTRTGASGHESDTGADPMLIEMTLIDIEVTLVSNELCFTRSGKTALTHSEYGLGVR